MKIIVDLSMHAFTEPGCAVKEALNQGKISSIRYDNYKALYEELKAIKGINIVGIYYILENK